MYGAVRRAKGAGEGLIFSPSPVLPFFLFIVNYFTYFRPFN